MRELKNNLSRYLERVRAGEQVVVTDHGRPVARLTPMDAGTDRLAELVAAGVVQAPKDSHATPAGASCPRQDDGQ